MALSEGVSTLYRCAFLRFFIGRFVAGWTRDSNWAAADAPVELILLRLGVWRAVDAATAWRDVLQNHCSLLADHPPISDPLHLLSHSFD
jgi:hypothetical protein